MQEPNIIPFEVRLAVAKQIGVRGLTRTDRRQIRGTGQEYFDKTLAERGMDALRDVIEPLIAQLHINGLPADQRPPIFKLRKSDNINSFRSPVKEIGNAHGTKILKGEHLTDEEVLFWTKVNGKRSNDTGELAPSVAELIKHMTDESRSIGLFEETNANLVALIPQKRLSASHMSAIEAYMNRSGETPEAASAEPSTITTEAQAQAVDNLIAATEIPAAKEQLAEAVSSQETASQDVSGAVEGQAVADAKPKTRRAAKKK